MSNKDLIGVIGTALDKGSYREVRWDRVPKLRIRQLHGVTGVFYMASIKGDFLKGYGCTPYKAYVDYFKPLIKQPPVIGMNNHGV